jgi:hypothetical protein
MCCSFQSFVAELRLRTCAGASAVPNLLHLLSICCRNTDTTLATVQAHIMRICCLLPPYSAAIACTLPTNHQPTLSLQPCKWLAYNAASANWHAVSMITSFSIALQSSRRPANSTARRSKTSQALSHACWLDRSLRHGRAVAVRPVGYACRAGFPGHCR